MPPMRRAILGYAIPLAAILVLGPLASLPLTLTRGVDASDAHALLVGTAPSMGLLAWLLLVAAAALATLAGARAIGPKEGWLAGALVLLWGAIRTGSARDLVLAGDYAAGALFIEGLLALAAVAIVALIAAAHARPIRAVAREAFDRRALVPIAAAACVAIVGATLVAREATKGQAVLAAFAAGILAGVAARLTGQDEPDEIASVRAIVGACLVALIAPIYTAVAQDAPALLHAGRSLGIGSILATDWAPGVLLGVPIGVQWVGGRHAR